LSFVFCEARTILHSSLANYLFINYEYTPLGGGWGGVNTLAIGYWLFPDELQATPGNDDRGALWCVWMLDRSPLKP
jgi:hypothetical protein